MQRHRKNSDDASPSDDKLQVLEEELAVSKETHVSGRVRVRSVTETVEERVRQTLEGHEVDIQRVTVDRFVDSIPETRVEGDVTIMPVVEEVLVVEKRLRLKEELHIRTVRTEEAVEVPITLRKQRAIVERLDAAGDTVQDEERPS